MTLSSATNLLRTALFECHVAAGARMVAFGGWEMPVQYSGILAEHQAVRETAGLFDLSHMGRLHFRGAEGRGLLQQLSTNDVETLGLERAQYNLLCNGAGGILDDTVAYNLGGELLLVVNASNRTKILDWIASQARAGLVDIVHDTTFETCMIGLQGPAAQDVLQPLTSLELSGLRYYRAARGRVADIDTLVARTGYTGEDGFELIVSSEDGGRLWQLLASSKDPLRAVLCGLGARDTLRLEAGMALYGHEITEQTNPYEAGLGRVVKLDKGDFIGREALARLRQQPSSRKLVGFQMIERTVPRQGYPILSAGQVVGEVTSGTFSPTLKRSLGMAYVPPHLAEPGSEIEVEIRGRPEKAEIVELPHYTHRARRTKPS